MASKRVFTSLEFQAGAKLVAPKVELRSPVATLTDSSDSDYYTGVAGQLAYGADTNLYLNDGSNWQQIHRKGVALSTGNQFTVSVGTGTAPFAITSKTKVDNLKVEALGSSTETLASGTHRISTTAAQHGIPVYGANGILKVGTPVADDDASSKGYVDTVAQGLSIKTAVKCATTANITIATALNVGDSIDGVTLANGDRVLVKDQSSTHENGVYTAGASPARATDYDAAGEISDGDFFFIQSGTANGNKGFVQTKNVSAIGSGNEIVFEQFSEAGNLEVYSRIDDNDGSKTTGPLIQTGNDVEFGYNGTHFDVDGSKNLRLKEGGVLGSRLADDAVTPAKLDSTGTFSMAGLTTSALSVGDYSGASPTLTFKASEDGTGRINFYDNNGTEGGSLRVTGESGGSRMYFANRWSTDSDSVTFDLENKKVGIGADATSPSGTLHVSTARYGSELITGVSSDYNASDISATTYSSAPGLHGWRNAGSNTLALTSNQIVITHAGNSNAAYRYFSAAYNGTNLVINRKYRITIDVKYTGSGNAPSLATHDGTGFLASSAWTNNGVLTQTLTNISTVFEAKSETNCFIQFSGMGSGQTIVVDNLKIHEDNLAAGVNSNGNDLVVSGKENTGISVISRAVTEASLYLGDGLDDDFSRIYSKRELDGTGTLKLDVNSATAIEIDNSQNVKVNSGLGIGDGVATASEYLRIKTGTNNRYAIQTINTAGKSTGGLHTETGGQGSIYLKDGQTSSAIKVSLRTNATSYFNGGNVAIGATSASQKLYIDDANSNSTWNSVQIKNTNTVGAGLTLDASTGEQWSIISNGSAGGVGQYNLGFHQTTSNGPDAAGYKLALQSDGSINQQGNSIVNSASIQGLQDGACYDFDGSADDMGVKIAGVDPTALSYITVSAWVKIDAKSSWGTIAMQSDSNDFDDGWGLNFYSEEDNLQFWIQRHTKAETAFADVSAHYGKWLHVVGTYDGTDQKLYFNGVEVASVADSWVNKGAATNEIHVGAGVGSSNTTLKYGLNGKIRDFKIFPLGLTAGDVRKLYSGENPKKNLNVELVTNGTFTSNINGWTDKSGTGSSVSHEVGNTVLFTGAAAWGIIEQSLALTANKTYHLRYEVVVAASGQGKVRVGTSSVGLEVYSNNSAGHTSTGYKDHFFTTSSTATHYISIHDGYNGLKIDNVTLREAGTLVDMTSQSASSSKWYNEAMANDGALYNGTLNGGVTLSAGNTYWNNIRQEGSTVLLSAAKNDDAKIKFLNQHSTTADAGISTWDDSTGTDILIGSNAYVNAAGSWKRFKETEESSFVYCRRAGEVYLGNGSSSANPIARLTIDAAGDTSLSGKLGVGAAASSEQLYVSGSVKATGNLEISGSQLYFLRAVDNGNPEFHIGKDASNECVMQSVYDSGTQILNRTTFTTKTTSSTANAGRFEFLPDEAGPVLTIEDAGLEVNGFVTLANTYGVTWGDLTARIEGHSTNNTVDIYTNNAKAFGINSDGTQDHQANRIVNSQTVTDSHRTAEPSLRFDGSNDYVSLGIDPQVWSQSVGSFSVWFKADTLANQDILQIHPSTTDFLLLRLTSGGLINLLGESGGSSTGSVVSPNQDKGYKVNEWVNVVGTCAGTGSDQVKLYVNGALAKEGTLTKWTQHLTPSSVRIAKSQWYYFKGEVKGFNWYNRVLDSDEVAAAYNGESTPWKYEDAAGEKIKGAGVNFATACANVGAFNTAYNGSANGNMYSSNAPTIVVASNAATITNTSTDSGNGAGLRFNIGAINGKKYRLKLNVSAITGTFYVKAYNGGWVSLATINSTGAKNFELDPWAYSDASLYLIGGAQNNAITITAGTINNSLAQIGEIAAYTPKSIGRRYEATGTAIKDKWFDETSNANHGTITGATSVGNTRVTHYGDLDMVDGGKLRINKQNDLTPVPDRYTEYQYSKIDTTPNTDGYSIRLAGSKKIEFFSTGEVKATNASGNLIQVARVYGKDMIGLNTPYDAFMFNHNLGTEFSVVSVVEKATPYADVEVEVRRGKWDNTTTQAAGSGVLATTNGGTNWGYVTNTTDDWVTIIFASHPSDTTEYRVTVTG